MKRDCITPIWPVLVSAGYHHLLNGPDGRLPPCGSEKRDVMPGRTK